MDYKGSLHGGEILVAIKDAINEYEGIQDLLARMRALGFDLVSNDIIGTTLSGPKGSIMFAVLPSFSPNRIFSLVVQLGGDSPLTLVSEGDVVAAG